jgi:putative membrane protein
MSLLKSLGSIALVCVVVTACDEPIESPPASQRTSATTATAPEPAPVAMPAPTPPAPALLNDSQSVEALGTLNHGEVELARYALERARTEPARHLAQTMIDEHTQAEADVVAWAQEHMVAGQANDVSPAVLASANAVRARLESTTDDDFDRAYVQSQIDMHSDALDILDQRIVPGAQDPAFRTLVTHIRGAVAMHLAHARTTLAELPHPSPAVAAAH